jgi:hypothetical protein
MYYKRRKSGRRFPEPVKRPKRGSRMTFFSLAAVMAFIAASKAANPQMNIKPLLMMFGGVALGCFILAFCAGRKKNDG